MSASESFPPHLAAELRSIPAVPPELRERVRALGEPAPRRELPGRLPFRRTVFLLVPATALALFVAAAVHGILSSPEPNRAQVALLPARRLRAHESAVGSVPLAPTVLPPRSATRHQDYQADLRVRVKDYEALGRQTAAAMRITTELGGFVASVDQSSARGTPGEADLVLRVPVANVERALAQLSALGTVLDQHVSIVDLEHAVQQQRELIRTLRIHIAKINAALRQSLPAAVRLRLQFQLDDARLALARATGAHKATLREAALSRIAVTLTTEHAAAAATHRRGRFGRAVASAADFLASAGAVALLVAIVVSPLVVVTLLWWYGGRVWRRREERRLLAET